MAVNIFKTGTQNAVTTTLDGAITDSDTTIALTNSTGLQAPGVITIDRLDANDVATPTVREYVSYTGISGNSLTGCDRSGLGGSTAQAHSSGAKVEEAWTITHWNDFLETFDVDHGTDGTHNSGLVLTLPQVNDTSSDHQYIFGVSELTADRTITLPLLTGDDDFVLEDHTQTLTNKRVTKRVTTITSNATPTINTDDCDVVTITALATAITSMTTNLSGTETNFQTLIFRILDDGTARAITWGDSFQAMGVALPTTTTISKVLTVGFIYDTVDSKWGCVASVEEA